MKDFKEVVNTKGCLEFVIRDKQTGEEAVFEVDKDAGETAATLLLNTGGSIRVVARGDQNAQVESLLAMFETIRYNLRLQPEELADMIMDTYYNNEIEQEEVDDVVDTDRGLN